MNLCLGEIFKSYAQIEQKPSLSLIHSQTNRLDNDILIIPQELSRHHQSIKTALIKARQVVKNRLGVTVPYVHLYLSATPEIMRQRASQNHRTLPPTWSAGLAFPKDRTVYIPVTAPNNLLPLLQHELVHIALAEAQIPLWVNEGLAVTLGDGLSFERLWTLNEAAAVHELHSFNDLTMRFPKHGRPAQIAYAQAGHFIHHLSEQEGRESLTQWVKLLTQGQTLDEAATQTFKLSLNEHERVWRKSLERGLLAWLALTAKSETLWALTMMIFIVLGYRKMRHKRLYYNNLYSRSHHDQHLFTAPVRVRDQHKVLSDQSKQC